VGTASATSAEPATTDADQPNPSRINPTTMAARESAPSQNSAKAPRSDACPASTTGVRPHRSASQPNTGDSAYIPATWRLIVNPTMVRVAPCIISCTGAIDISATMVPWLRAITVTA